MTWTFYAVQFTTGQLIAELPLTDVQATRHLEIGEFSATLPFDTGQLPFYNAYGEVIPENQAMYAEWDNATTVEKYTVVLDLDGVPVGEWIIHKKTPTPAGHQLNGSEFKSYLGRRPVPVAVRQDDQLEIANFLIQAACWLQGPGYVSVATPELPRSEVIRQVKYPVGDGGSILQRLNDISDLPDGFDWTIDLGWTSIGGLRYLTRTVRYGFPQLGRNIQVTLDLPGPGQPGGLIAAFSMPQDGGKLASITIAYGSGQGSAKVQAQATDLTLVRAGYPMLNRWVSKTNVKDLDEIQGAASALLAVSKTPEVPPTLAVFVDRDELRIGDWQLGDTVLVDIAPRPEIPNGWRSLVRITGWTFNPVPGQPEIVALTVTSLNPDEGFES